MQPGLFLCARCALPSLEEGLLQPLSDVHAVYLPCARSTGRFAKSTFQSEAARRVATQRLTALLLHRSRLDARVDSISPDMSQATGWQMRHDTVCRDRCCRFTKQWQFFYLSFTICAQMGLRVILVLFIAASPYTVSPFQPQRHRFFGIPCLKRTPRFVFLRSCWNARFAP